MKMPCPKPLDRAPAERSNRQAAIPGSEPRPALHPADAGQSACITRCYLLPPGPARDQCLRMCM